MVKCSIFGSLKIQFYLRNTEVAVGTLRMMRAPAFATERIQVWINKTRVLLSAVFDISTGFSVTGDYCSLDVAAFTSITVLIKNENKVKVDCKNKKPAV